MSEASDYADNPIVPAIKCPQCPMCGALPMLLFPGLAQCWCPNDECEVFMWTPWDTAKQNLDDVARLADSDVMPPE